LEPTTTQRSFDLLEWHSKMRLSGLRRIDHYRPFCLRQLTAQIKGPTIWPAEQPQQSFLERRLGMSCARAPAEKKPAEAG
jgi:hypothetical protein